ncbi:DUF2249 domain-containing protein [uncultured Actinomyces sp.]|uniref:DUF2249 domain-containing protein n=1 Tax=uncultured Actinomyces sp. TaxID=249061 RepID=UPI0028DB4BF2|nr:DUF2249 domain-containing protein [uncultured Actinomyces sp.]
MSEDPNLIPVTEIRRTGHSCGCGEHDPERLTLDARAIPHRLRHAAVIGAVSSLQVGEGLDLVAPHVPTPLLVQIDQQLPMTFQHTLLETEDGYARVEILRTA